MGTYVHSSRCITADMTSNVLPSPLVASASSEYSTSWSAWRAFNQDTTTGWSAIDTNLPTWLQVDLGSGNSATVATYTLSARSDGASFLGTTPRSWTLSGSNDGSTWTVLHTVVGSSAFGVSEMRTYTVETCAAYRYFRLTVSENQADGTATAIGELELLTVNTALTRLAYVHDDRCLTPLMTSNNAQVPVVASASSEFSTTWSAWRAFNQAIATGWATLSATLPAWLKVDLGANKGMPVGSYSITARNDTSLNGSPTEWVLEGSNDDSAWTTVHSVTGEPAWTQAEMRIYECAPSAAWRYYRLTITATQVASNGAALGELELLPPTGAPTLLARRGRDRFLHR